MLVYAYHRYTESHVQEVMQDMERLGPPTIRCTPDGDGLMAIEGVHRMEAAKRLGLPIYLRILPNDTPVAELDLDWQDAEEGSTLADMVAYTSERGCCYSDTELLP